MKTKYILLLVLSGILTLSFTFASVNQKSRENRTETSKTAQNEPIGGFVSADKF